jgi:hypothetical protein
MYVDNGLVFCKHARAFADSDPNKALFDPSVRTALRFQETAVQIA